MNRRRFLRQAALTAGALAVAPSLPARPARLGRKPNLIVFLPDQQRADTVPGYSRCTTHAPHLAKLAATSTLFERAYVTHPVCTPSRSSLLTGTWPHQNGCMTNNTPLRDGTLTLPQLLDDPDYRTAYMGKWHLGDEVFAQRGFQEWVSIEDIYQNNFSAGRDPSAITDYSRYLLGLGYKPDRKNYFSREFATKLPIEQGKPAFLEREARRFLERHRDQPFILFVSYLEPHTPYSGPLNHEHSSDEVRFDANVNHAFGPEDPLKYRLKAEYMLEKYGRNEGDYRDTKRNYMGLVTQIDRSIGGILSSVEQLGIADDTIVVHTSDHGDMMGAHHLFEKEVMFEEAARVPYLVHLPGQQRPHRVTQPVSHIDFIPSLLDLLGSDPHRQCAGRSHAALARGEQMAPENIFLQWSPKPNNAERVLDSTTLATPAEVARACSESTRTVVTPDGWKLSLRDLDRGELYHLPSDPLEMTNLYPDGRQAALVRRLRADIQTWQERSADTLVLASM